MFFGRRRKGPIKKRLCPPSADGLKREAVAIAPPSLGWKRAGNRSHSKNGRCDLLRTSRNPNVFWDSTAEVAACGARCYNCHRCEPGLHRLNPNGRCQLRRRSFIPDSIWDDRGKV